MYIERIDFLHHTLLYSKKSFSIEHYFIQRCQNHHHQLPFRLSTYLEDANAQPNKYWQWKKRYAKEACDLPKDHILTHHILRRKKNICEKPKKRGEEQSRLGEVFKQVRKRPNGLKIIKSSRIFPKNIKMREYFGFKLV